MHHGVRRLHRRQVGDDRDIVVPAGALDVDVDGALDLAVETRHHARGVSHIGQATLAVVPGGREIAVRAISKRRTYRYMFHIYSMWKHMFAQSDDPRDTDRGHLREELAVVIKANTGGQESTVLGARVIGNSTEHDEHETCKTSFCI